MLLLKVNVDPTDTFLSLIRSMGGYLSKKVAPHKIIRGTLRTAVYQIVLGVVLDLELIYASEYRIDFAPIIYFSHERSSVLRY